MAETPAMLCIVQGGTLSQRRRLNAQGSFKNPKHSTRLRSRSELYKDREAQGSACPQNNLSAKKIINSNQATYKVENEYFLGAEDAMIIGKMKDIADPTSTGEMAIMQHGL